MARVRIPSFVGPSYTPESRISAYDRTVNLIAEKVESGTGQAPYALYLTPGYREFCELPETPVRGLYTLNGVSWAVGGETLYRLPTTLGGSPTLLTTGVTNVDDGWVTIAGNGDSGDQLMLSSGSFKFCFEIATNTLTPIAGVSNQVGYLDGYFLSLDTSRSELTISAPRNGQSWDPLDVKQREDAADKWISMLVHQAGKELWLFGSQTSSVLYHDAGAALAGDFPFVGNPNVFVTQGIAAAASACVLKGAPIWLGQGIDGGGVVYWANGYTPTRVSTHAVETALASYDTLSTAYAFVYEERGHSFYVLTFPGVSTYGEPVTVGATWVFDATTGFWHERGEWNGWSYGALPIIGHLYANGVHLVGSPDSGVIYQQSKSLLTTTAGDGIRWFRRAPHVAKDHSYLIVDSLELLMEVGLGLPSGQGANPIVNLAWSHNGGQSFLPMRAKTAGRVGAFDTHVKWNQLGRGDDWVFEASGSDPVPTRLLDAFLEARAE
jgi:hypothetical protein